LIFQVLEMQDELSSQQSSKGTFETDLKTIKVSGGKQLPSG
jgi:hypothetical protein